jgi:hypothetical protein
MRPARSPAGVARLGVALVVVVHLMGCATSTVVTPLVPMVAARKGGCHVNVIARGGAVPAGHRAVARIESHIQRDFFFGGRVSLQDEAYRELRAKACEAGGDQVRVDDFMESQAAEMTHVHVWATVFSRE